MGGLTPRPVPGSPSAPAGGGRRIPGGEGGEAAEEARRGAPTDAGPSPSPTEPPPAIVIGRVAAREDDRPLADAIISAVTGPRGEAWLETSPGASGEFRLVVSDPPETESRLVVRAPRRIALESPPFRLAPGDRVDLGSLRLAPGCRVSGRVADDRGRPLDAAVDLLESSLCPPPFATLADVVAAILREPVPLSSTATDAAGRFAFDGLAPGAYALRARARAAEGREDGIVEPIVLTALAPEDERTIRLAPGGSVSGRVLSSDLAPAPGLRVLAAVAGDGWPPPTRTVAAVTGIDGRYVLSGLPAAAVSIIVETPEGSLALSRQVVPPIDDVDVVLSSPLEVTGRVLDAETGAGIASAQVFGITRDLAASLALTGPDGRFSLALAAGDGDLTIVASAPGYADGSATPSPEEAATGGGCEIRLEAGVALAGRVVRAEDGAPLPGVGVLASAGGIGDGMISRATTDETGAFSLAVAKGKVRLLADAPAGLAPAPKERPLEITIGEAGAAEPVTLTLVAASRLAVRVLSPDGRPAAGARVTLLGEERNPPVRSNGDGVANFEGLSRGAAVSAVAEGSDGSFGLLSPPLRLAEAESECEVRLSPPAGVAVRVIEATSGLGIAGARVTLLPRSFLLLGTEEAQIPRRATEDLLRRHVRRAMTDAGGALAFERCLPGSSDLLVSAEGHPTVRVGGVAPAPEPEERVVALPAGLDLHGRVVDPASGPLAAAWVVLDAPGVPPCTFVTGEDGSFEFHGVPSPPYTLRASRAGYREQTISVKVQDQAKREFVVELRRRRD